MRVGIAALMLAAGQAAATPPDVCGLLGEATGWSIIAAASVTMREGTGYHEQSEVEGPICAGTASLQNVWVRGQFVPGGIPGDVVALAAAGRAIQLRPSPQSCLYCAGYISIYGDVITGGGLVTGVDQIFTIPDTSGTSPRLADCQRAIAAAADASARLAALPPTHVYGAVAIGIGEGLTIDARGGAVIQMDSLTMKSGKINYLYDDAPVVKVCDTSPESVSTLRLLADPGDQVVINVPRLSIGSCAQTDTKDAVFNVPGPGGTVALGTEQGYEFGSTPVILAPERNVKLRGSSADLPPFLGAIYAKRLKTTGNVFIVDAFALDLPCHPAP